MQRIPNNCIKWDGPCYKCKSYFCDRTCEEDALNVVRGPSDLEHRRRDEAFADFIGGVAYEEDRGWSKEVWDAAWSARREWVGLTDEDLSVCDTDGVILARYWEAKLREKNT